jgi:membrane-bound lytic murein transglycosylase B
VKNILTLFFLICAPLASLAETLREVAPEWDYCEKQLVKAGLRPQFIAELKQHYDPSRFSEVLELNTLLFLKRSDYHGIQVNTEAVTAVKSFVKENQETFLIAQKKYGVPGEVISALLWIESRHGSNKGQFHVPSVFVDLLQVDRKPVIQHLYQAAKKFTRTVTKKNKRDIVSRTKKRVKWATAELKAIDTMHLRNPKVLKNFKGSFAGAFGMSQFIPSSYVFYARSGSSDRTPNLELAEDAILSVASYLHESGWRKSKKTHTRALMKYNNSQDYAAAIVKLAQQSVIYDPLSKRTPAEQN